MSEPDDAAEVVRLRWKVDQHAKDLTRLNDFLEKRESFIREGMGVFANFHQRALDSQDRERSRFEQEMSIRTAVIDGLNASLAQRDAMIARLESELAHSIQLAAACNPLRSRTISGCHSVVLTGFKLLDSLWIGLVRMTRGHFHHSQS